MSQARWLACISDLGVRLKGVALFTLAEQAAMNAANTVFGALRLLGWKFSDAAVQRDMKYSPVKIKADAAGAPVFVVQSRGETVEITVDYVLTRLFLKVCVQGEGCAPSPLTN